MNLSKANSPHYMYRLGLSGAISSARTHSGGEKIMLAEARWLIACAERKPGSVCVDTIETYIREANAEPEEIGTTWKHIDELRRMDSLADARRFLAMAESVHQLVTIICIEDSLSAADATPEEIGTTQARLDELCRLAHLAEARGALTRAERGFDMALNVVEVNYHLDRANAMPEEIGTSRRRLTQLQYERPAPRATVDGSAMTQ